ncbi:hypothetical protein G6L95_06650 [Agrobacterium rhizogenes]|nr:hypothetical protein [Rhizobium rhizogenes]NTI54630.1 hypothetical protein [Rhizobium rhizogenes]
MQSKKQNETTGAVSDLPENASVFDFLYYDATRIASFLAQFQSFGHATQVTAGEQASQASRDTQKTEIAGSVKIAKGAWEDTSETSKQYLQQFNKTYDPRWANALAFLDYLEQKKLLNRDIGSAAIGQIALITGDLSIFDLNILQKMWALPSVKKTILAGARTDAAVNRAGNRQERRKAEASNRKSVADELPQMELALELLTVLPHAIQAAVSTDAASAWCSLREDSITVSSSDLFMKHGLTITGEWALVGILDASPDDQTEIQSGVTVEAARQAIAGSKLGMAGFAIAPALVQPVRTMLGRPATSYGVTPLLIFREISSPIVDA